VALYANITTDSVLTKARTSTSTEIRAKAIDTFVEELNSTVPAIFLYVPTITIIEPKVLTREPVKKMSAAYERFTNIEDWYIKTENIWPIFNKN
jgi:ABC-type transport system substrate-binding protein